MTRIEKKRKVEKLSKKLLEKKYNRDNYPKLSRKDRETMAFNQAIIQIGREA